MSNLAISYTHQYQLKKTPTLFQTLVILRPRRSLLVAPTLPRRSESHHIYLSGELYISQPSYRHARERITMRECSVRYSKGSVNNNIAEWSSVHLRSWRFLPDFFSSKLCFDGNPFLRVGYCNRCRGQSNTIAAHPTCRPSLPPAPCLLPMPYY